MGLIGSALKRKSMDWREEVVWRERTRELLDVELGARVIDCMRPIDPDIFPVNLMPEQAPKQPYGPVAAHVDIEPVWQDTGNSTQFPTPEAGAFEGEDDA
jgi:hypothetical protein